MKTDDEFWRVVAARNAALERAEKAEAATVAVSSYLYKRSKYGDEEADEILRQWYPEATP